MEQSRLTLWATRLAWGLLALDLAPIFIVPANANFGSRILMYAYAAWLIATLFAATIWLMITHRRFFRSWLGWSIPVILLLFSNLVVQGVLPINQPNLFFFFSLLAMVSLWLVVVASGILLWHRDVGFGMIGWGLALFVWLAYFAWRFQGNLIELWFFSMGQPGATSPLWWFGPIVWILLWNFIIGMISFVGHTLRIFAKELAKPQPGLTGTK
jgi:hypothetical protein